MTLHYVFTNETLIEVEWQKIRQGVILIYSHKQGHLSCIDILTLKLDILKRKIKESNP